MTPISHYVDCGGRQVHCLEWGAGHRDAVIAWHGLARTGRDMDELAQQLAVHYRVLCPDTLGRGLSQWSPDPAADYRLPAYVRCAMQLMDTLRVDHAHWVGTSMGGQIGMACAAGLMEPRLAGRVRSLVLNDMAPQIEDAAVARIRAYAGNPPAFDTVTQLEAFFRQVYQPFGQLSDPQWRRLTEASLRRLPDGRVTAHYDPALVPQLHDDDLKNWRHYDALRIPVLMLRGEDSDLVARETVEKMHTRGAGKLGLLRTVEIAGCGHAPALNVPEQLDLVCGFIDSVAAR